MAGEILYPYPRLAHDDVRWPRWGVIVDGAPLGLEELDERVDLQSEIGFRLHVMVHSAGVRETGYRPESLEVVAEMQSPDTNVRRAVRRHLEEDSEGHLSADISLDTSGAELGQEFVLEAAIVRVPETGEIGHDVGMPQRLMERPPEKHRLAERARFPTVGYSFEDAGLRPVPWFLEVDADDPQAPMNVHVRLHLNTDLEDVEALLEGNATEVMMTDLARDTARSLVHEARRLVAAVSSGGAGMDVARVVRENPESVLAAAHQASTTYLKSDLTDAFHLFDEYPREFEMRLAAGTRYWNGGVR